MMNFYDGMTKDQVRQLFDSYEKAIADLGAEMLLKVMSLEAEIAIKDRRIEDLERRHAALIVRARGMRDDATD